MATPHARTVALVASLVLLVAACASGGESGGGAAVAQDAATTRKVTVAGDSISVGLGAALREEVPSDVEVKVIGEEGTGLARPDVFDWPERLRELARDFPPTVLAFSVGSNDAQDLTDASGQVVAAMADTGAWEAEYRARLAAAFDAFAGTGVTVVWVGHVEPAHAEIGTANRRIHQLAVEVAAERDFVQVEDLGELLGTGDLVASACLLDDGLHLTVDCLADAADGLEPRLPLE